MYLSTRACLTLIRRCLLLLVLLVCLLSVHFWASNRKVDRGEKIIEGSHEFRYTI